MSTLPIDQLRSDFDAALAAGHVVVEAPTGSGKSTRLPLWCLQHGRVLIVEPRRIAARSLARYVAELEGSELGETVGYAVRFDTRYGPESKALFATPGVALRWLAEDGLAGFSTVILDEFHERRWDTDLLIALLRHRRRHRLVVSSATVAGQRLAQFLDGSRLEAQGHLYPVEVRYQGDRELPHTKDLDKRVAQAVIQAFKETDSGDILVFLPGRGEIQAAKTALASRIKAEVIPLHAGVDTALQDRALRPADHRRVILATNVAETSLTLPGVRVVVDSGLERRTHHRNGRTVLGLHCISRAAAEQRRGRAGRLGPGRCLRLWQNSGRLEEYTPPEVVREELTELILAAAAAGQSVAELQFPDPLPEHAVKRARERLQAMAALDVQDRITEHGRRLYPLPLDPLFAHLITAMPDRETREAMVDLAAALATKRSPLPPVKGERARERLREWVPEACDATTLIRLVRSDPPQGIPVDSHLLAEARRIADQTRIVLELPPRQPDEPVPRERLLEAAIHAAPELAFVRRHKRRWTLGNGRDEIEVGEASRFPQEEEAAVVFDQHTVPAKGTTQTLDFGTCMAPVPLEMLARADLGEVEHAEPRWDGSTVSVQASRVFAGREIVVERIEPTGTAARQAIARLILEGQLMAPLGDQIKEEVEAWNLYLRLGYAEGEPVEPQEWLEARLEALGVEHGEDIGLLEAGDLAFEGIPELERPRFDRHYPRALRLENLDVVVHYEPRHKRVTVERTGGTRRSPPARRELPAWKGWSIRYRDGSREVPIS